MAGLRIDTHLRDGAWVPPYYDSLLAKVIVHGDDRATALGRLEQALAECRIDGVATNLAFHRSVTADAGFRAGGVDTGFLEKFLSGLQKENTAHG
jgi:acetyl-CoA carboxylase biotin carboxylase subunit